MARNSTGFTFFVAFLLCVVCSVLVSSAAVVLKPTQEANKVLDRKRNILSAAGLEQNGQSIDELFQNIETKIVDLETGQYNEQIDPESYDFVAAASDPQMSVDIPASEDQAGIKRHARYIPVYLVRSKGDAVDKVILPVYGKGLWSTLYGFITLDRKDLNTIRSLLFYEHAETPGLGGEVDNPAWKALWKGKKAYGTDGDVEISVIRGSVDPTAADAEHKVDGLSGATITSRGVEHLLRYWLSDNGYGAYLDRLRATTQGEA